MKYIYHCIIPFLVLCVDLHAQQIISNSLVETENQKNPDIVKINQLWTDYLMSSPDSLYNNPYWNCRDKEKYKVMICSVLKGIWNYMDWRNMVN